ncbi:hypothetical protein GCM10009092_29360 [Bowmanella denitrificans]|uniref:Uncharacterized protein n=1 Tax=Bowmanella denitrificans TaxID=366582 RepID=A0ABN0XFT8_9ALTE
MLLSSLIILPTIWVSVFLLSFDFEETTALIVENIDLILVIFTVGTCFEIGDRLYRGAKKGKIITIIRDKDDRW